MADLTSSRFGRRCAAGVCRDGSRRARSRGPARPHRIRGLFLMPEAWRIVKAKHAATAFSGEGAARTGGRWNSRGVPVVYTSSTKSLAALESLVHLNPPVLFKYVAIRIQFDDALI